LWEIKGSEGYIYAAFTDQSGFLRERKWNIGHWCRPTLKCVLHRWRLGTQPMSTFPFLNHEWSQFSMKSITNHCTLA